jgi:hypothetical protein
MSLQFDATIAPSGTKFRIFPLPRYANAPAFSTPETVIVSIPPAQMQPGPADDRMYVIDAVDKEPYDPFQVPPYSGKANPKVQPAANGHFDHINPKSREFLLCTMYATVRRVLDIWQDYFRRPIEWHFASQLQRLELIPLINWNNAQSGFGFLEFGYGARPNGGIDFQRPYCENFDVLAHELGHSIIFAEVGVPKFNATLDYGGFHESAGDLVAIVSLLHFNSIVEHLLESSRGNLFTVNELTRVGELSSSQQIRMALNYLRMSDVGAEPHDRSEPLTGAFFDVLVEIYQRRLVEADCITRDLAEASLGPRGQSAEADELQKEFNVAYAKNPGGFKKALLEARDEFGYLLAGVWSTLSPENLTYADVARATLAQDAKLNEGVNREAIRSSFLWREIAVPAGSPLRAIHRVQHSTREHAETAMELLSVVTHGLAQVKSQNVGVPEGAPAATSQPAPAAVGTGAEPKSKKPAKR